MLGPHRGMGPAVPTPALWLHDPHIPLGRCVGGWSGAPGTLSASLLLPPASWAARGRGAGTVLLPGGEGSPPCFLAQTPVSL